MRFRERFRATNDKDFNVSLFVPQSLAKVCVCVRDAKISNQIYLNVLVLKKHVKDTPLETSSTNQHETPRPQVLSIEVVPHLHKCLCRTHLTVLPCLRQKNTLLLVSDMIWAWNIS